jgi:integrase/recombinase XerD
MTDAPLTTLHDFELLPAEGIDPFRRACDDFFAARISNGHTRKAYLRSARHFFAWCEARNVPLNRVTAGLIARYFNEQGWAVPTEKQRLAALRILFDHLVAERILHVNPAASVRRERYSPDEGKTAEVTTEEVRRLVASIDVTTLIGLRDRAIIGVLNFTGARVGAVAGLRLSDLTHDGTHPILHFREKNGKPRSIPVRADLAAWLHEYLIAVVVDGEPVDRKGTPLFRTVRQRSGVSFPTEYATCGETIRRMVKRRCKAAGLSDRITPHSFRVKTVTTLLQAGQPLEDVQYLVGHADPRTTRLYDRRKKQVTWALVHCIPE